MNQTTYPRSLHVPRSSPARRTMLGLAAILTLPFAALSQAAPPAPAVNAIVPAINQSLRPALEQVGAALGQVQIDRWKLSRDWKSQLHSDVDSIQQDLLSQLPALFLTADQSPQTLGPQLAVMHNVDALYDVMVRISTAANLAGGRNDAGLLDTALEHLESARKTAAGQLQQAASMQDAKVAKFQAVIRNAEQAETANSSHPKTIVVNNAPSHRRRHKPVKHHKPNPETPAAGTPAPTPHPSAP